MTAHLINQLYINNIKISPEIAGKLLGMPAQRVRIGLQRGQLPIGTAILYRQWRYDIRPERMAQYMGISREELMRRVGEV